MPAALATRKPRKHIPKRDFSFPAMSEINADLVSKAIQDPESLSPDEAIELSNIIKKDSSVSSEIERVRNFITI